MSLQPVSSFNLTLLIVCYQVNHSNRLKPSDEVQPHSMCFNLLGHFDGIS
jgi:hypothetical protein